MKIEVKKKGVNDRDSDKVEVYWEKENMVLVKTIKASSKLKVCIGNVDNRKKKNISSIKTITARLI